MWLSKYQTRVPLDLIVCRAPGAIIIGPDIIHSIWWALSFHLSVMDRRFWIILSFNCSNVFSLKSDFPLSLSLSPFLVFSLFSVFLVLLYPPVSFLPICFSLFFFVSFFLFTSLSLSLLIFTSLCFFLFMGLIPKSIGFKGKMSILFHGPWDSHPRSLSVSFACTSLSMCVKLETQVLSGHASKVKFPWPAVTPLSDHNPLYVLLSKKEAVEPCPYGVLGSLLALLNDNTH